MKSRMRRLRAAVDIAKRVRVKQARWGRWKGPFRRPKKRLWLLWGKTKTNRNELEYKHDSIKKSVEIADATFAITGNHEGRKIKTTSTFNHF